MGVCVWLITVMSVIGECTYCTTSIFIGPIYKCLQDSGVCLHLTNQIN